MSHARLKLSRAFTLIEVIIVVTILGILVAIGAFSYGAITKTSRENAVAKTGNQIAKAVAGASTDAERSPATLTKSQVDNALAGDVYSVTAPTGTYTSPAGGTANTTRALVYAGAGIRYYDANECWVNIPLNGTKVGQLPTVASKGTCP